MSKKSMSNLRDLRGDFQKSASEVTLDDLKAIIKSQAEIIKQQEEKIHSLLEKKSGVSSSKTLIANPNISDDLFVAEAQLQRLKEVSMTRDLTLDETRQFEIYSKIKIRCLHSEDNAKKPKLSEPMTTEQLLEMAEADSSDEAK
jgi:hypothetical protein